MDRFDFPSVQEAVLQCVLELVGNTLIRDAQIPFSRLLLATCRVMQATRKDDPRNARAKSIFNLYSSSSDEFPIEPAPFTELMQSLLYPGATSMEVNLASRMMGQWDCRGSQPTDSPEPTDLLAFAVQLLFAPSYSESASHFITIITACIHHMIYDVPTQITRLCEQCVIPRLIELLPNGHWDSPNNVQKILDYIVSAKDISCEWLRPVLPSLIDHAETTPARIYCLMEVAAALISHRGLEVSPYNDNPHVRVRTFFICCVA